MVHIQFVKQGKFVLQTQPVTKCGKSWLSSSLASVCLEPHIQESPQTGLSGLFVLLCISTFPKDVCTKPSTTFGAMLISCCYFASSIWKPLLSQTLVFQVLLKLVSTHTRHLSGMSLGDTGQPERNKQWRFSPRERTPAICVHSVLLPIVIDFWELGKMPQSQRCHNHHSIWLYEDKGLDSEFNDCR